MHRGVGDFWKIFEYLKYFTNIPAQIETSFDLQNEWKQRYFERKYTHVSQVVLREICRYSKFFNPKNKLRWNVSRKESFKQT